MPKSTMMPPVSSSGSEGPWTLTFHVDRATEVAWLQAEVRRFVRRMGLSFKVEWAIAIAISEAATNVQKFAGHGVITLIRESGAIMFVAEDEGPGIDCDTALRDGVSEGIDLATVEPRVGRRGLGTGLARHSPLDGRALDRAPPWRRHPPRCATSTFLELGFVVPAPSPFVERDVLQGKLPRIRK